jgi:hypothetical protein
VTCSAGTTLRAAFLHPAHQVATGQLKRGRETGENAGQQRRCEYVEDHVRIDVNPIRLRDIGGRYCGQRAHPRIGKEKSGASSHDRDHHVLGKNALRDPPA